MTSPIEALQHFEIALRQIAPKISSRLQPGLADTEINAKIASFAWNLPQDVYNLYQWHNGLSGEPGKLNLAEKLLRLKDKWHGGAFAFDAAHYTFEGLVSNKKALVITPNAGNFAPSGPMEYLNFCETYLKSVLSFIGIKDTTIVAVPNQFMSDEVRQQSIE